MFKFFAGAGQPRFAMELEQTISSWAINIKKSP